MWDMFHSNALKGWDMDDDEPPPGRDAKFSWEVIRDNSIFTYRIDLVPAYAEVMAALQVFRAENRRAVGVHRKESICRREWLEDVGGYECVFVRGLTE